MHVKILRYKQTTETSFRPGYMYNYIIFYIDKRSRNKIIRFITSDVKIFIISN